MSTDSITINKLVLHEKRLIKFYYRIFLGILILALIVIAIYVLRGEFNTIGFTTLSSFFITVTSYFPIHQVSKRKDHITALEALPELMNSETFSTTANDILKTRLLKMIED